MRTPPSPGTLDAVRITVECPDLCPRFTARAFEDVKIGPSPVWLKARLMAAGQRPISNIVDITNYVMLLTGQPLHAFDLDRIAGAQLTVRQARDGETVQTLDGQTRRLDSDMVLIADDEGPTSIAGVMGGARSEVQDGTTRVLMEVANWDGANIHRTSLKLGLRSEASGRNEKGLQPEQAMEAQAIATQLMIELCGARMLPGTIDVGGDGPPLKTVVLRDARVTRLLGVEVPRERCAEILTALEFTPTLAPDGLDVVVPAFRRSDVTREADLIEEVARLGALQDLPATLPSRHGASGRLTDVQRLRRSAADALTAQGLHEIVGWSFEGPEQVARLRIADRPVVELENPMSADQSRLRTTLLGSLLDVGQRNRSRGASALRLFEAGAVYLPDGARGHPAALPVRALPRRRAALGPGAARHVARSRAPRRRTSSRPRACWPGCSTPCTSPGRWRPTPRRRPSCTPGVRRGSSSVGLPRAGSARSTPRSRPTWDYDAGVAAFEVDLDAAAGHVRFATYEDLTSFPEVREDLAVIVADTVTAAQVLEVVRGRGRLAARRGRGLRRLPRRAAHRRRQCVAGRAPALPRRRPHPHRRGGGRPAAQDRLGAGRAARGEGA